MANGAQKPSGASAAGDSALHYYAPNKPIRLNNLTCIYCGRRFSHDGGGRRTKEHVIARKFVPCGVLDGCWNLIAWACLKCNGEKAKVEEHVSAITMQPTVFGKYATNDSYLPEEARRKAFGSKSRRTGKLVAASNEEVALEGELLRGLNIKFNVTAPPQIDEEQAWKLAKFQAGAFFYMITYDRQSRTGRFWLGPFGPVGVFRKGDWGNRQIRGFEELTRPWPPCVHAEGAEGYFRMLLRRAPDDVPVWAWALEWNHSHRIFGFCGAEERIKSLFQRIPPLEWQWVREPSGATFRFRLEVPLASEDDHFFEV